MDTEKLLQDLIVEVHKMNENIIKLLERDKMQNERIKDVESEIKSLKIDQQKDKEYLYKIIGMISCIAFIVPIILRILDK